MARDSPSGYSLAGQSGLVFHVVHLPADRASCSVAQLLDGLEQRGEKGDGDFRPGDGGGYVEPKKADYSHLLSRGDSDLQMLLFETFGGWSVPVVRLFNKMRDKVRDKLSKKQYDDEVSWTTRTWSSLMAQRMSVALHMAAAWEIARELSLAGAEDEAALFGGGVADSVA